MKRRHHAPEQIVRKLREAVRLLGEGTPLVEVCKQLEVTEATYYRRRNQCKGMKADDAKRLKVLERVNAQLEHQVAESNLLKTNDGLASAPLQPPLASMGVTKILDHQWSDSVMHDFGRFVYLEMQKSGSTYVNTFLRKCSLIKSIKHHKHQVIRSDYSSAKFYFTTIRHPMGLYSSLYRFGLDGHGALFASLKENGRTACYSSITKFVDFLSEPRNAVFIGEGFSEEISTQMGFMSFRFLRQSMQFPMRKIHTTLLGGGTLSNLEKNFITDLEIKNEELTAGLRLIAWDLFPQYFDQDKADAFLRGSPRINESKSEQTSRMQKELEYAFDKIRWKESLLLSRYWPAPV